MEYHLDGPSEEDDDDDEVMQLDQEDVAMDTVLDLASTTTASAGDIMPRSVSHCGMAAIANFRL
jgi:hypothetical protein